MLWGLDELCRDIYGKGGVRILTFPSPNIFSKLKYLLIDTVVVWVRMAPKAPGSTTFPESTASSGPSIQIHGPGSVSGNSLSRQVPKLLVLPVWRLLFGCHHPADLFLTEYASFPYPGQATWFSVGVNHCGSCFWIFSFHTQRFL